MSAADAYGIHKKWAKTHMGEYDDCLYNLVIGHLPIDL